MISLCVVQTDNIASGVPIPAPLGSPEGPNQWFYGAPVVLALIPLFFIIINKLPVCNSISSISLNISQKL